MADERTCTVTGCHRPAHWGRNGFPGFICGHHGSIWQDSAERLEVLETGRHWARLRAAYEMERGLRR